MRRDGLLCGGVELEDGVLGGACERVLGRKGLLSRDETRMQVDDGEGLVGVCGMCQLLNERSSKDSGPVIGCRGGLLGVEGMGRQGLDDSVLTRGRAGLDGMGAVVEEKNVGAGSAEVGVEDGGLDKGGAGGATAGCAVS